MTCNHGCAAGETCLRCFLDGARPALVASPTTPLRAGRDRAIGRELYRRSFPAFPSAAWPTIEPTRALLPSVAIEGVCAALQAVAEGRIKRLAIATCPGTSKSLAGTVAFPAWLLLRS